MRFSIIVPSYNEQDNIAQVIEKIRQSMDGLDYELIVVNDHSIDATPDLVKDISRKYKNIRLVENDLERGFGNAIRTGFKNISTDIVVPVMGDLCDELSTIKKMLDKIEAGYDVVCGARYIKGGKRIGGSKFKGFFSSFAGRSLYYLLGLPTHDIANAFKMYRKKALDSIDIKAKSFEISMEIPLKLYYAGFGMTEVPTVWRERTKGKSSFKIFKLFPNYFRLYSWAIFKRIFILCRYSR